VVRCDGPEQDVKRLIGKEPILEFMSSKAGTIVVGLFICFSFSGYSYQLLGGGIGVLPQFSLTSSYKFYRLLPESALHHIH